jgi:uncharacterized damage-inducible protein DinB
MNREAITALVAYDDWANDLIVEALVALSEEELNRPLPGSFASLRATWAHLVMAEWLWLERWLGRPPEALPEWVASAGLGQLNDTLLDVRRRRRDTLELLGDSDFAERRTYSNLARNKTWNITVGQMLAHVVNHSTYHRGQITTLLRQLGKSGVTSDFLLFAHQP